MIKNVSESLAGRMADFELRPFSLYERQRKPFEQKPYLPTGELPKRKLDADARHWFFNGLLHTYIERDVQQTAGVSKMDEFRRFLLRL